MQKKGRRSIVRERASKDREIAESFLELLRWMKRYVREEFPPLARKELSEEKLRCLGVLRCLGKSHLKPLATYDGLSSSSQCLLLNRLVEEGLVARSEDPSDRRNVFYELTVDGRDVVKAAQTERIHFLCGRLRRLGEAEKARFARALAVVRTLGDKLTSSGEPGVNATSS